jgi:hypothetical protein
MKKYNKRRKFVRIERIVRGKKRCIKRKNMSIERSDLGRNKYRSQKPRK